jgi:hypothetical protein
MENNRYALLRHLLTGYHVGYAMTKYRKNDETPKYPNTQRMTNDE